LVLRHWLADSAGPVTGGRAVTFPPGMAAVAGRVGAHVVPSDLRDLTGPGANPNADSLPD